MQVEISLEPRASIFLFCIQILLTLNLQPYRNVVKWLSFWLLWLVSVNAGTGQIDLQENRLLCPRVQLQIHIDLVLQL